MALFNKKADPKKEAATPATKPGTHVVGVASSGLAHVLKHARITEKATMHQGAGVYTFDIAGGATKRDIIVAIRTLYKVTPIKVAVVAVPSKVRRSMRTGKVGIKRGGRKAYVYLKKGDTITIV